MLVVAESIARAGVFQTHNSGDLTGVHSVDVLTMVRVHVQQTAETLALAADGVHRCFAGLNGAGVDTDERQASDERVRHHLEDETGKGAVHVRGESDLFVRLGVHADNGRNIQRRGQEIDNGIEQLLHAFVLVRRTAEDGNHAAADGRLADDRAQTVGGDLLAFQIHLRDLIVKERYGIDELFPVLGGKIRHVLGDGLHAHILTQIVVEHDGIHVDEIDDPTEVGFLSDGQLDGHGIRLQTVMDHVHDVVEVGAGDIHLIDVDHARNIVMVRLTPHRFRLWLDTALGAEDGHAAVQHAQAALHLGSEVDMARRIDDVDARILPEAGGSSARDGDTALLLLRHPVHRGVAFMGLADFVVDAGIEENTLGSRRLTRINVRHDADVSGFFK